MRIGAYDIISPLGAGGMGEVYRARDTKLGRDVALKILPEQFAADADRLSRFRREAQALAALNHPNIAAIYGLEESGQATALVLELVDGATIADRLATGPLPIGDALGFVVQIADALEAAHAAGVIHRDLKPANIKVRHDGTVKVLDFGLARLTEPPGSNEPLSHPDALSHSPTVTSPAVTRLGVVLGTAAYMAPEQARGRTVDKRADIWAFGCVLYEMLTGARPFGGDEVADTLALVLTQDPDWSKLPVTTPTAVRQLLRRCLQKDPRLRLHDIADARLELTDALTEPETAAIPAMPRRRRRELIAWGLAGLGFAAAITTAIWARQQGKPREAAVTRFTFTPPEGWRLTLTGGETSLSAAAAVPITISPDGTRVAFLATGPAGRSEIWVRQLDAVAAQPFPGTVGATAPFWSPDSRFIGFFADGRIKKIDTAGGPPVTVVETANYRGGSWGDGIVVFSAGPTSAIFKVPAAGGAPVAVTTLEPGETGHARPAFLPDGHHFLFRSIDGPLFVGSVDDGERTVVIQNPEANIAAYAAGYLLYVRNSMLVAQPFDLRTHQLTGEAMRVADQIRIAGNPPTPSFSVSTNGVLAYDATGALTGQSVQLRWYDRQGVQRGVLGEPATYGDIEVSPDGKRVAVTVVDAVTRARDVWVFDIASGLRTRLTFGADTERLPLWSRDGTRIVYGGRRTSGGPMDLFESPARGGSSERLVLADMRDKNPVSWSADGDLLVYTAAADRAGTQSDLMLVPVQGDRMPRTYLASPATESFGRVSPDGRWIAYMSNESGRSEVYAAKFPTFSGKWQLSTGGGGQPRWNGQGEILYGTLDYKLTSVPVRIAGDALEVGKPTTLFGAPAAGVGSQWDMLPGGDRFLVSTAITEGTAGQTPITVVVNWPAALGK
jgi:eukaryotic-like serine/threonine-protein kinase